MTPELERYIKAVEDSYRCWLEYLAAVDRKDIKESDRLDKERSVRVNECERACHAFEDQVRRDMKR